MVTDNNESVSKEERVIADITDIHSFVRFVLDNAKQGKCVYRGHASKDWQLKSSIGRNVNYSKKLEKEVFLRFKQNYYSYTSERPGSDIDLLFLAQHYSLPTRLLDFTYNPMIALYFACEKEFDMDGRVYVKSIEKMLLMDANSDKDMPQSIDDVLNINRALFVVPNYTDTRYKNQKALFLLSDKPARPFTFVNDSYIIKKECKKQILRDLSCLGYDKTLVYPLLDSLCADIKREYGFG